MSENGTYQRRQADTKLSQLHGAFEQHVESTTRNFKELYQKSEASKLAIESVSKDVHSIKESVEPIKDIAAFFRVLKWTAATIVALTPVAAVVVWLVKEFSL